jgi:hypothetical protein
MQHFNKNPLNATNEQQQNTERQRSPQIIIEDRMKNDVFQGNYESAFLFSTEGLPLAQVMDKDYIDQAGMVEISLVLKEIQHTVKSAADIDGIKEIVIEGLNKRKVIFRLFKVLDQLCILAVVVTPKRSYRSLTNRLVKTIKEVMTE